MKNKKKLIDHLKNDIYCRIGVSKIHGVGVMAIKSIPKGINPFKNLSKEKEKIIELDDTDLKKVNNEVKKMVKDFFGANQKSYDVLYDGPNHLNLSYYLNHSDKPNLDLIEGPSNYLEFKTNRNIKKGEELFINYNDYQLQFAKAKA
ncbi:MAG: SET domain-containing protein [Oligoflexia bacterium]|nr:SET domain-containing protein [Oligoflexia bacterium]MBF0366945.1 SET domain-containing protein [Oligoflexia bacterium]